MTCLKVCVAWLAEVFASALLLYRLTIMKGEVLFCLLQRMASL